MSKTDTASSDELKRPRGVIPWVEKYRPNRVEDVAHQTQVVDTLKKSLETANLPHLLFYGPPGTGKTTAILAIGKQLFGPAFFKHRVLELNASDERGINVVRTKIKTFAQTAVGASKPPGYGYPVPPFKLIILDEADSMTPDAQAALRRTMETYSKVTRFCLICNYVSRIIDPITSRCAKFRFRPLDRAALVERLRYIAEREDVKVSDECVDRIVRVSEGDMRKAITLLQSAVRMYGNEITPQHIMEIAGQVPDEEIHGFLRACRSNDFNRLQTAVSNLIHNGFPASQLLNQLHDAIVDSKDIDDIAMANIGMQIARTESRLIDGADEYLQLLDLGAVIMRTAGAEVSRDRKSVV